MKKLFLIIIAIVLLAILLLVDWRHISSQPHPKANLPLKEYAIEPLNEVVPQTPSRPEVKITLSETPLYQMVKTQSSFDPVADAEQKKKSPFRMYGSGGIGRIVDASGNIISQSDSENAIFSCEVSPDQTRIMINRGDGIYDIVTPSTGQIFRLPQQPPPKDTTLGFTWHWFNDRMLLGISGDTIPFRDDQVGPEREEPNISHSLLCLYDLEHNTMSAVSLPPNLPAKVVSIHVIDAAGKVELFPENHDVPYTSLGWFEILPVNAANKTVP